MSDDLHKGQITRLKRIEGQVRGITKMIEEDRYCIDILTQIKAVKSAVAKVEASIIETHLDHCVHKAVNSKDKASKENVVEEIRDLLKAR